jgi:hypothetical protein
MRLEFHAGGLGARFLDLVDETLERIARDPLASAGDGAAHEDLNAAG